MAKNTGRGSRVQGRLTDTRFGDDHIVIRRRVVRRERWIRVAARTILALLTRRRGMSVMDAAEAARLRALDNGVPTDAEARARSGLLSDRYDAWLAAHDAEVARAAAERALREAADALTRRANVIDRASNRLWQMSGYDGESPSGRSALWAAARVGQIHEDAARLVASADRLAADGT